MDASMRACPNPLLVGQQAMDWVSYFFGGKSGNGEDGPGLREIIEACCPTYLPTSVAKLEKNRQTMGLALAGQLSVVMCRVLTGHLGGGVVGLFVFVVGNNARCSLQASNLTLYVVLGTCVGAMDIFDLFQRLVGGVSLVALPFLDNMAQDLEAMSLFLAPVFEVGGARVAWDSYLSPAMLFEASAPNSSHAPMSSTANWFGSPIFMPQMLQGSQLQSMPPMYEGNPMETRMPVMQQVSGWPMESMFAGWPGFDARTRHDNRSSCAEDHSQGGGGTWTWNNESDRSHGYRSQHGYWSRSTFPSSSQEAPFRNRTNSVDTVCCQCDMHVSAQNGWLGTGEYAGQVYCTVCWQNWQSRS
eukprot:TRINITY_DN29949_c0_g1_i1.p1 TRINITY_DN29949_c0_g1~~TRINITY_DN29949_c0_g1_i1.p1  ORF type:complete len:375 (+),score=47.82 TRINITY_DN29949_c0_g1_i1:55-1125(+)